MSVCVTVKTKKSVKPDDFLKKLAESGEQIVVTSNEFPCVKFGNVQAALRGIEVNQEEDGLEVRVCSFASVADYKLFAKTIAVLLKLTGGKTYDDDDCLVDDPITKFNDKWIEEQRESSFMLNNVISAKTGTTNSYSMVYSNSSVLVRTCLKVSILPLIPITTRKTWTGCRSTW